jgi:hypothetical protein
VGAWLIGIADAPKTTKKKTSGDEGEKMEVDEIS